MGVHRKWQPKITANLSFSPHHVQVNHLTCVTQLFHITHLWGSEELSNFSKVIELESSKGRELSKLMPAMQETRYPSRRGLLSMSCPTWGRGSAGLSVVQSINCVRLFATPWTAAYQASLSFTISHSLLKLMSTETVMPPNHFIFCCPLFLLPSIFPSIWVFSSESALSIRWPKY